MKPPRHASHVIGIDDGSFEHQHRGDVLVVAVAYARLRMEGVMTTHVRRDGNDATDAVARMLMTSRFHKQAKLVLLNGIALGGFNVIDVHALAKSIEVPVLVIARRPPDLEAMRRALDRVGEAEAKWAMIEKAGPMERVGSLCVQRAGLTLVEAKRAIEELLVQGNIPEPLRVAHLIAGGVSTGHSRGRA